MSCLCLIYTALKAKFEAERKCFYHLWGSLLSFTQPLHLFLSFLIIDVGCISPSLAHIPLASSEQCREPARLVPCKGKSSRQLPGEASWNGPAEHHAVAHPAGCSSCTWNNSFLEQSQFFYIAVIQICNTSCYCAKPTAIPRFEAQIFPWLVVFQDYSDNP